MQDVVGQELCSNVVVSQHVIHTNSIKALSNFSKEALLLTVLSKDNASSVAIEAHCSDPASMINIRAEANSAQIDVNIVSEHIRRKKLLWLIWMQRSSVANLSMNLQI